MRTSCAIPRSSARISRSEQPQRRINPRLVRRCTPYMAHPGCHARGSKEQESRPSRGGSLTYLDNIYGTFVILRFDAKGIDDTAFCRF